MGDTQLPQIPTFQSPVPAESPAINELLNEKFILQRGLAYHKYKIIHPIGKTLYTLALKDQSYDDYAFCLQ